MKGVYIINNLWFNASNLTIGCTTCTIINWSHNSYFQMADNSADKDHDPFKQVSNENPVVDWQKNNLRLSKATAAGIVLADPFNIDPDGKVRGADGVWDRGAFEFTAEIQQSIPLSKGWNWVSFNIVPADLSFNSVFSGILDKIEQIKTQTQSTIHSGGIWKGDLANMSGIGQYKMYKVKVSTACTLTVTGTAILSANPIHLGGGWNWVAYLPTTAISITTALASISGQVIEVKSRSGSATYNGGSWSGTLTQLEPGQGYAIKMNAPGTLTYPAGK
jgi:hypothetical protein